MDDIESENRPRRETRKPRLALMGEFSAGKSTLTNMLLGSDPIPTRVTATRLPPVWIAYGDAPSVRIDMQGKSHPVELAKLDEVDLEETRLIRLYMKSETLELCDLIDFPGISDPNMPTDRWENVMDDVDSVIWCTHATQAWRQSEAATWEKVMGQTNGNNILLVTQIDKLQSQRDRDRVMARIRNETEGLFCGHYPISVTDALQAGDDFQRWTASGAAAFTEHLVGLLLDANENNNLVGEVQVLSDPETSPIPATTASETAVDPLEDQVVKLVSDEPKIRPKRVRKPRGRLRTRPLAAFDDTAPFDKLLANSGEGQ